MAYKQQNRRSKCKEAAATGKQYTLHASTCWPGVCASRLPCSCLTPAAPIASPAERQGPSSATPSQRMHVAQLALAGGRQHASPRPRWCGFWASPSRANHLPAKAERACTGSQQSAVLCSETGSCFSWPGRLWRLSSQSKGTAQWTQHRAAQALPPPPRGLCGVASVAPGWFAHTRQSGVCVCQYT